MLEYHKIKWNYIPVVSNIPFWKNIYESVRFLLVLQIFFFVSFGIHVTMQHKKRATIADYPFYVRYTCMF